MQKTAPEHKGLHGKDSLKATTENSNPQHELFKGKGDSPKRGTVRIGVDGCQLDAVSVQTGYASCSESRCQSTSTARPPGERSALDLDKLASFAAGLVPPKSG